jgi:2-hydroxychromene-2-carboxylate isomerase
MAELSREQEAYVDWLCTPKKDRDPATTVALAQKLGVNDRTLRVWRQREDFREEWNRRSKAVVGSPERTAQVIDELFAAAMDRESGKQVSAAKLYLETVGALQPPEVKVQVSNTSDLTDEQLNALMAEMTAIEAAKRKLGAPSE